MSSSQLNACVSEHKLDCILVPRSTYGVTTWALDRDQRSKYGVGGDLVIEEKFNLQHSNNLSGQVTEEVRVGDLIIF